MKINIIFILIMSVLHSCITTYGEYPKAEEPKPAEVYNIKLAYNIEGFGVIEFGGYNELNRILKEKIIFSETEEYLEIPKEGHYCVVKSEWVPFTVTTLVFMYISNSSYTLLPAWSHDEGYKVKYSLYKNGQLVKDFEYRIKRSIYYWGFLLPFIWVNFLTPNEEMAFRGTAYQFAKDVKPYIK